MSNTIADMHIEKGMEKGKVECAREMLLSLLEDRFGKVSTDFAQQIELTEDLAQLQKAILKAARVSKLDEFRL